MKLLKKKNYATENISDSKILDSRQIWKVICVNIQKKHHSFVKYVFKNSKIKETTMIITEDILIKNHSNVLYVLENIIGNISWRNIWIKNISKKISLNYSSKNIFTEFIKKTCW